MSRSFKKTPIVKDNSKGEKNFANRKVRRSKDVPNGKGYRKFYNPYDICDWSIRWTKQGYIERWERRKNVHRHWSPRFEKTFHEEMRYWYRHYYWK